ncbi:MAG: hypothetical protein MZV64_33570 [Ignavibacteriales bacterium]|nr:hypothetical protein [Ignavibacteriales bacterium]
MSGGGPTARRRSRGRNGPGSRRRRRGWRTVRRSSDLLLEEDALDLLQADRGRVEEGPDVLDGLAQLLGSRSGAEMLPRVSWVVRLDRPDEAVQVLGHGHELLRRPGEFEARPSPKLASVFSRDVRRDSRTPERAAELFSAFSRKAENLSTFSGAQELGDPLGRRLDVGDDVVGLLRRGPGPWGSPPWALQVRRGQRAAAHPRCTSARSGRRRPGRRCMSVFMTSPGRILTSTWTLSRSVAADLDPDRPGRPRRPGT